MDWLGGGFPASPTMPQFRLGPVVTDRDGIELQQAHPEGCVNASRHPSRMIGG